MIFVSWIDLRVCRYKRDKLNSVKGDERCFQDFSLIHQLVLNAVVSEFSVGFHSHLL